MSRLIPLPETIQAEQDIQAAFRNEFQLVKCDREDLGIGEDGWRRRRHTHTVFADADDRDSYYLAGVTADWQGRSAELADAHARIGAPWGERIQLGSGDMERALDVLEQRVKAAFRAYPGRGEGSFGVV